MTATPQAKLAPALNLSVVSTDEADPRPVDWQGTLVYEPIYQSQDATTATWQTWDATADNAQWWFTKDVLASDGSVVIAKQTTRTMDEFLAAFDENAKYADLRLDPRGGGLQVSLGQAGYNAGTSNITALVDGVTFGTSVGSTTYDFAEGIGSCVAEVDGSTYTLTEDCETFSTLEFRRRRPRSTATGTRSPRSRTPPTRHFPDPVVKSATGTNSAAASFNVRNLTIDSELPAVPTAAASSPASRCCVPVDRSATSPSTASPTATVSRRATPSRSGTASSADDINVPRARVSLDNVTTTNYQKTGVLLDGNLAFTATRPDHRRCRHP